MATRDYNFVTGVTSATEPTASTPTVSTDLTTKSYVDNALTTAEFARTQIAAGTANHVLINDGTGELSSEAQLAKSRGGAGADMSSVTFPSSGTIVTTAGTLTLTNKDIDGGTASNTSRITLPKNTKTNLDGLTRKEGTVVYATDTGLPYFDNGSVLTAIGSGTGSGGSGINYIDYPDAENGTTNWATYADAAATPVDLTGGSPTATFATDATTPLRGTYDFKFTAGTLGDGVAVTITPDRADIVGAKVLEISFDYELSGTISDGDYQIWVYQVGPNSLTQPTPYKIPSGVTGYGYSWKGTFQLATTTTSVRVALHQAVSTSVNIFTDNWYCGPVVKSYGDFIVDEFATNTSGITTAGATDSTSGNMVYGGEGSTAAGGTAIGSIASTTTNSVTSMYVTFSDTIRSTDELLLEFKSPESDLWIPDGGFSGTSTYTVHNNAIFGVGLTRDSGDPKRLIVTFGNSGRHPGGTYGTNGTTWSGISTWKWRVRRRRLIKNVVLASENDGRDLNEIYSGTVSMNNGIGSPVNLSTKVVSTHNAVTTGASWKFTAPYADVYTVNFNGTSDQTTTTGECFAYLYKGGVLECDLAYQHKTSTSNLRVRLIGSYDIFLNAGEYIDIRLAANGFSANIAARVAISRTGTHNGTITKGEFVGCSYFTNAGSTITNNTVTYVDYEDKVYDSHGMVLGAGSGVVTTTNTGWRAIIPIAGKYSISAALVSATGGGWAAAEEWSLGIRVNNTAIATNRIFSQATHTTYMSSSVDVTLNLVAGDRVEIIIYQTSGASLAALVSTATNYVCITKVD